MSSATEVCSSAAVAMNRLHRVSDALQHRPGLGHLLDAFIAARLPAFDGLRSIHRTGLHVLNDLVDLDD